jgi:hypothetical protein
VTTTWNNPHRKHSYVRFKCFWDWRSFIKPEQFKDELYKYLQIGESAGYCQALTKPFKAAHYKISCYVNSTQNNKNGKSISSRHPAPQKKISKPYKKLRRLSTNCDDQT